MKVLSLGVCVTELLNEGVVFGCLCVSDARTTE